MTIAETILSQLGGKRFILFTGCKDFYSSENNTVLTMTIPRNGSKANLLEVKYNYGTDSYDMKFYKRTAPRYSQKNFIAGKDPWIPEKITIVKEFKEIYCDQLQELFTEVTSLYTHF